MTSPVGAAGQRGQSWGCWEPPGRGGAELGAAVLGQLVAAGSHLLLAQIQTFNEARVMVRKPALELLAYLKGSNFAHPAVRYVICIL